MLFIAIRYVSDSRGLLICFLMYEDHILMTLWSTGKNIRQIISVLGSASFPARNSPRATVPLCAAALPAKQHNATNLLVSRVRSIGVVQRASPSRVFCWLGLRVWDKLLRISVHRTATIWWRKQHFLPLVQDAGSGIVFSKVTVSLKTWLLVAFCPNLNIFHKNMYKLEKKFLTPKEYILFLVWPFVMWRESCEQWRRQKYLRGVVITYY